MFKGLKNTTILLVLSVALSACEKESTQEETKTTSTSQLEQAIASINSNDLPAAEQILDQISTEGLETDSLKALSNSYLVIGQPQKALDTLAPSLSRESDPQIMLVAGLAYEATEQKFLAEHWLGMAAETAETDGLVQLAYIDWMIRKGRHAEANAYLASKVENYPAFSPFLERFVRTGIQSDRAITAANILLNIQDKNPEIPWMLAILYNNLEMWPETLAAAESALASNPKNQRQRQGMAQILSNILSQASASADWATAEKAADLLMQIDHSRLDWFEARLRIALSQRDFSTATDLLNSSDTVTASQRSRFFGDIALAKGNLDAANGHYLDAWNAEPNMALASRLNHVRSILGFNDTLDYIKQWTKKDASNSEAFLALAMSEEQAGNSESAVMAYLDSIKIAPQQWVAHNNLAWLYSKQGSGEEALSHAQQAVDIKPNAGEVVDTLAWMHHLHGQADEAKKWSQRAVALAPGNEEVKQHFDAIHNQ